jgi:hypothetical protein
MISNGETTKTKVVDLEKLYTFIVDHFLFEIIKLRIIMSKFLIFEIQNFQTTSDGETTKTKVVDLEKLYIFVSHHFLFEFVKSTKHTYFEVGSA